MLAYQVCECTRSAPSQAAARREVDAEGGERGVRAGQLGEVGVAGRAVLLARLAERVHAHVEVTALAQRPHELGHVDPRSAVDRRGVLLADRMSMRTKVTLVTRRGLPARAGTQ